MLLLDLDALDEPHRLVALDYLVTHGLRSTDIAALERPGLTPRDALTERVTMSRDAHLILDDHQRPIGLLAVRPWGAPAGVDEGLLWAVCRPELEKPMPELLAAIAPVLAEIATAVPGLWAYKAPTDAPEALPRLADDARPGDLMLVGPEPWLGTPDWLASFQLDRKPIPSA